ncbi:MAG: HlyD family type I secretion periplasmic adaptor subunit [Halothiobacillus sp.]
MRPHRQAQGVLWQKYKQIFSTVWARRKALDAPVKLPHEQQFLPSALALQETPMHPLPRTVAGVILAFALIAILWSILGHMDIVAVARGKIIPDQRTKTIQPIDTAIVKQINVRDGQHVQAGDVLVALDSTLERADVQRLDDDLITARLDAARNQGLLVAIDGDEKAPRLDIDPLTSSSRLAAEQQLLDGHVRQFRSQLAQMEAEVDRRKQEVNVLKATVSKIEQTLPIIRRRAADFKKLSTLGHVSQHQYLELEQTLIEQTRELLTQQAKLAETKAALVESEQQKAAFIEQSRREALDNLHLANTKVTGLNQDLIKAEQRNRLMSLQAPVTGTVQQLSVHTIGGVVTPAQPLMVIVPHDNLMEVDALLPNNDIGFVRPGQVATVKIDTFPYTRYGTISGVVAHVSDDAIQDEKLGLVYAMRVRLNQQTILVNDQSIRLSPGMAVSVEIKTGQRRIIEYFLAPLLQYSSESLHER